jgi:SAM-dependent methyltransferase
MSHIYKTGRAELYKQIKRHAHYIHGHVLDIGAGNHPRYQHLFRYSEYIKMNLAVGKNTDAVGTIEAIPFPTDSFDSIICTQVLGDVYNLQQAFIEMQRVVKPGGVILVTENLFDPLHDQPHDYWRFTRYSLERLAQEAGLIIEVLEERGGYHSLIAQLRARYWIERWQAHRRWFAKILSMIFKIDGELSRWLDHYDHSTTKKIFTHGYLLIARTHA